MFRIKQGGMHAAAGGLVAVTTLAMMPLQQVRAEEAARQVVQLEEVIVTARKREEKLFDVPLSIQAFSEAEIEASGIKDIQSLKDRAQFQVPPAVSTGPGGRLGGNIIFRGLQNNSFGGARDSSGSLFVDGIYISGGQQSVNTVDVSRIEVVKGPQNTYFGRSTFGGAINFITRNPSDKFGGQVDTTMTARGSVDTDASVEGPLVSGLLTGRLTAYVHSKVDQYHTTDGGGLGGENTKSLTGTLYFTPKDKLWVRLRASLQRDEDSANDIALLSANNLAAGACTGRVFSGYNQRTGVQGITLARNYFCNGLPTLSSLGTDIITQTTAVPLGFRDAIRANTPGVPFWSNAPFLDHAGLKRNAVSVSLQSGYTFESGASMAFSGGYNQQKSMDIWDVDRSDPSLFFSAEAFITNDLTLDARFLTSPTNRLRGLIGASYFRATNQISQMDWQYATTVATRSGNFANEIAEVPAVYGSIDFDILKNLTVTAEGRYQQDKPTSKNVADQSFSAKFSDFLPRLTVKFSPIESLNLYASYAKGVQPAGFSGAYVSLNATQQAFVQSVYPGVTQFSKVPKVDSYEIGAKQILLDGAFEYNLAAYTMKWKDAVTTSSLFNPASCFNTTPATQLTAACPLAITGTSLQVPNDARIKGIELSLTGRLNSQWTVDLTADYKDARWITFANSGFNAFAGLTTTGDVYRADGNGLGRVPKFSGTVSSTYRGQINGDTSWYTRGDVLYTGSAWDSDLNIFKTDAYTRVNVRAGIERGALTLEAFSTNLFNNTAWDYSAITVELTGNFTQRAALVAPAQKREFGLRAAYKF